MIPFSCTLMTKCCFPAWILLSLETGMTKSVSEPYVVGGGVRAASLPKRQAVLDHLWNKH